MIIQCSKPVYLYIHVCMIGNYIDILRSYRNQMQELNIFGHFTKILFGIVGRNDENMRQEVLNIFSTGNNHIELLEFSENISVYERLTLHNLYDRSLQEDFHVLYLHTKGVTHSTLDQGIVIWREKMTHFLFHYMTIALHQLEHDKADAIGIDFLREKPRQYSTHYSGNFWWSKSSHIRTLYIPIRGDYLAPEMWICSRGDGKYASLYQTPHYDFYRAVNIRNKNEILSKFRNNQLEPHLLQPEIVDLFLEDILGCIDHQWYGHPPNWVKVDSDDFTTGFHKVNEDFLRIGHDPYLGKTKFWVFMHPDTHLFSAYIENQPLYIKTREPITLEYEYISSSIYYGTETKSKHYDKTRLTFQSNVECTIGNHLFNNEDPDYGKLKRWKLNYKDKNMELLEHQKIIIIKSDYVDTPETVVQGTE